MSSRCHQIYGVVCVGARITQSRLPLWGSSDQLSIWLWQPQCFYCSMSLPSRYLLVASMQIHLLLMEWLEYYDEVKCQVTIKVLITEVTTTILNILEIMNFWSCAPLQSLYLLPCNVTSFVITADFRAQILPRWFKKVVESGTKCTKFWFNSTIHCWIDLNLPPWTHCHCARG